jgi:two-component system response regulator HydG
MANDLQLVVVRLSDSFAEFWPLLAREAGATLRLIDPATPDLPLDHGAVLIVLAAGGREHDAPAMIEQLAPPVDVPVVVACALTSHRIAALALHAGAADYVALPEDRDVLRELLAAALRRRRAALERSSLAQLEAQAHAFRDIVGESPALKAALTRAARVLRHADATVLIAGETGTGKELIARALHYGGPRATAPFVELNCAALPTQLLESELFGHERGAFTDARTAKPGLFEVAEGGTLFLDEIHQLALELQAKLLRALDQKTVRRVGGTASRTIDVRIVAATNADLAAAVAAGTFRPDLYYRLNVVTITLPPLRDRGDDALILAEFFARKFAAQYNLPEPHIGADERQAVMSHPWPGNVRELRNAIERALLLSPPGTLAAGELTPAPAPPRTSGPLPFPAPLAAIARAAAHAMLEATAGNRSEAARRLGISRSRLQRLLSGESGDDSAPDAD